MARAGVGLGIHGNGLDAEAAGRLDDPARYFAAVGDQDLVEHFVSRFSVEATSVARLFVDRAPAGRLKSPLALHPGCRALVEKGGEAFPGFGRGAQSGNAAGGVFDECVGDRLIDHGADQILGRRL
jgi:hypothetical protein